MSCRIATRPKSQVCRVTKNSCTGCVLHNNTFERMLVKPLTDLHIFKYILDVYTIALFQQMAVKCIEGVPLSNLHKVHGLEGRKPE